MDHKLALTIINEFNSKVDEDKRLYYESSDTLAVQGMALDILNDAEDAWNEGLRGEFVSTIRSLGNQPDTENNFNPEELRWIAEANIKKEKLPVPPELDGEPPELPRDISALSNTALRRMHGEFHACLARANWLVAIEEADEYAADQIARHYKAMVLRDLADKADKNVKITALEAEAAGDDRVRTWTQRKNKHYVQVKLLKSLRDTYEQTCERMSREFTMRSSEL